MLFLSLFKIVPRDSQWFLKWMLNGGKWSGIDALELINEWKGGGRGVHADSSWRFGALCHFLAVKDRRGAVGGSVKTPFVKTLLQRPMRWPPRELISCREPDGRMRRTSRSDITKFPFSLGVFSSFPTKWLFYFFLSCSPPYPSFLFLLSLLWSLFFIHIIHPYILYAFI